MRTTALLLFVSTVLFSSRFGVTQGIQGKVLLTGKTTIQTTGHTVALTWNSSTGASSYNVYRANTHGGPYTKISTGLTTTAYTDNKVNCSQTLYYVTTAVQGSSESGYSNEAVVSVP